MIVRVDDHAEAVDPEDGPHTDLTLGLFQAPAQRSEFWTGDGDVDCDRRATTGLGADLGDQQGGRAFPGDRKRADQAVLP